MLGRRAGWTPSELQMAQTSHVAIALAVVGWFACFGARGGLEALAVVGYAVLKEYVFDIIVEGDDWWDSTVDFLWYMAGMIAGMALLYVRFFFDGMT